MALANYGFVKIIRYLWIAVGGLTPVASGQQTGAITVRHRYHSIPVVLCPAVCTGLWSPTSTLVICEMRNANVPMGNLRNPDAKRMFFVHCVLCF